MRKHAYHPAPRVPGQALPCPALLARPARRLGLDHGGLRGQRLWPLCSSESSTPRPGHLETWESDPVASQSLICSSVYVSRFQTTNLHTEVGGRGAPDPGGPDNQSQLLSQQDPSEENAGAGSTRDRAILNQVQEAKACMRNQKQEVQLQGPNRALGWSGGCRT